MAQINIDNFIPKAVDSFFFDTNIWLLIFGDIANFQKNEQAKYSKILQTLLGRDYPIFLTANVISEFANVLLRRSYKDWRVEQDNVGKDFKRDFVSSPVYFEQVELISRLITKITNLPCVQRIPDDFNAVNLDRILQNFKTIDFNDAYIAEICQRKSLKLVTNDRDFFALKESIDIISAIA